MHTKSALETAFDRQMMGHPTSADLPLDGMHSFDVPSIPVDKHAIEEAIAALQKIFSH